MLPQLGKESVPTSSRPICGGRRFRRRASTSSTRSEWFTTSKLLLAGVRALAKLVRPGGELRLYVYRTLDDEPWWKRGLFRAVTGSGRSPLVCPTRRSMRFRGSSQLLRPSCSCGLGACSGAGPGVIGPRGTCRSSTTPMCRSGWSCRSSSIGWWRRSRVGSAGGTSRAGFVKWVSRSWRSCPASAGGRSGSGRRLRPNGTRLEREPRRAPALGGGGQAEAPSVRGRTVLAGGEKP